ncbi:MAG: DnaD domain protein [Bacilli bacterium]
MKQMFEALDLRHLLLDHYKALGFQEKHVMVILIMDQLIKQENHLITAELLSLKMSLSLEEIDQVLVDLLQRQFIEYQTKDGKTVTSLEPLKQLLYKRFQQDVIRQTQEVNLTEQANLFQTIERGFGRTLSPLEVSRIQDWLNFGYSESLITASLQDAIQKQKKSIRHMDKFLQKQTNKDNFAQEGQTALHQKPHQSVEDSLGAINETLTHVGKPKK